MSSAHDKAQAALDECRILVLCGEVLIGFSAQSVFEPRFGELAGAPRAAAVACMALLIAAVGLLMWPAAFHQVACRGTDGPRLQRFATVVLSIGLAPYAAAIGCALLIAASHPLGVATACIVAACVCAAALTLWYLWPFSVRSPGAPMSTHTDDDLTHRIRQVMTEVRLVLPGAQALLGFGTVATLMTAYADLSPLLKGVHLAGLAFIATATVLLMTPAAFHRIAERGEPTPRLLHVASTLLLLAMGALAPGLGASLWLVVELATGSRAAAIASACGAVAALYTGWFVCSALARRPRGTEAR